MPSSPFGSLNRPNPSPMPDWSPCRSISLPLQTHGFWVDVFVPPEAVPGEYRGTYRVTADDKLLATVPVTLTVWDFELPRVSTMVTALGSPAERMRGYYAKRAKAGKEPEPADYSVIDDQCAELLSRHRINASPPPRSLAPVAQPDGSFEVPAEQIDALRKFIDRYHVNALRLPHPRTAIKNPQTENKKLRAWLAAWDQAAAQLDRPKVVFYFYLKDEPNDEEAYQYVQLWGRAICQGQLRRQGNGCRTNLDTRRSLGRSLRSRQHLVPTVSLVQSRECGQASGTRRNRLDLHGSLPTE